MGTKDTYTLEVTGKQAHILASWLSALAQDVTSEETEEAGEQHRRDMEMLAPVGKRCTEIAAEAGEWEADDGM